MKRFYLILISLSMILATVSCDFTPKNNNPTKDPETEEPNIPGEEPQDDLTFERLFNDDLFKTLTIKISEAEWNRFKTKQQSNQNQFGTMRVDEYFKIELIYEDLDGSYTISNVGFRNRGNTSLDWISNNDGSPRINHFKFKFNYQFSGNHTENKGRKIFNLKEIDLKYNRNNVPHYMTEAYSMEMFQHYDVYAQETSHALVKIEIGNQKYTYGVYTIFEPIDDEFIERRFEKDASNGPLYKVLWQGYGPASLQPIKNNNEIGEETLTYHPSYDLKTNENEMNKHEALKAFIQNINQKNGVDFKDYIEENFNVKMFLRYLAVNVFLGNPDDFRSMGNNYYLYQDSKTSVWNFIPYDFDHALGNGWNPTGNYTIGLDIYDWFNQMAINSGDYSYRPVLVDKIFEHQEYRDLYEAILKEILDDDYFTFNYFYQRYIKTRDLYQNTFNEAIMNLGFQRGNAEWYINAKRNDINSQLN